MSANQKQAPSVVPQPQSRYAQGPSYIPQRPPTPQRPDGFHVATPPTFVPQQPPNQANNQVPPLRGMPPTVPPTQASTPPNTDLKVQQMPQQPSMNIAYVSQAQVRTPAQNFYSRAPPPNNQTQRMANHRQGQQPLYQTQTQFVPMAMQPTLYLNPSTPVQYFNGGPRPQTSYVAPGYQMLPGQHIATYSYQQAPSQPQAAYFYNTPQLMQRPPPQVASAPQNPTQPPAPTMSLPQPAPQHGSVSKNKRRSRAIPIIDPNTGKDKLSEMYEQEQDDSHPPSGESSARQTPQPPLPNPNKEVQAAFAKQVAQAIGKDEVSAAEELEQPPVLDHMGGHPMYQPPPQAVHQRFDTIVQSSKLQAATKEFIPAALSTAKETTPVVSAITDAVEVTITNKPKDRESPAKGRKQREQVNPREREHKDSFKEVSGKDVSICEKPVSSSSKDESKIKDAVVLSVGPSKDAPAAFSQRGDDKKTQKKDKADIKPSPPSSIAASEDNSLDSGIVIPATLSIPDPSCSAKSKHNASQKTKEVPKQQPPPPLPQQPQQQIPPLPQQQQQQPQPMMPQPPPSAPIAQKPAVQPVPPVPVTQPSKPTNKTNKMRELNLKGASKEGTDMDAFNDNVDIVDDATNANHSNTSSVNTTDYINNTNNVMLNNNINNSSSTVINDSNKRAESNDVSTIKPLAEIKTLPKGKIDVTDIVKENPKPIKTIVVPTPAESQDEPDHAALANDKMVQAKNEANSKASAEVIDANTTETKINLPYREDQWSPFNKDGKKVYDKDFLLALRKDPKSNKKPDNLPADILANDERGRIGDISRYAVGGRATDFAPNFSSSSYPNKSSSQRGVPPKRKSQQGSIGGGGGKGGKQAVIRLSISVKEDVKLHETENAWRPARLNAGANQTEDEKKTGELYKKVRGVLNKLTPQKFDTLLGQVRSLAIDNTERLQGVIDLVFEKAVDEPNFSVAYALLCRELALMQVPADGKKKEGQEFVNFRKLLVTRCQLEFEKNSIDETERSKKIKEMEDCADPEKKKDMQLDLEEYDRRLRMKSVGNIRFIGELFKQQMLTVNIMLRCLNNLVATKDEESLECLCKLVTTVGKELESKKVDLSAIFLAMKELADKKHGNISSRVRFMIQDVIDLRACRWVPRRQDLNPKTMDQIQKEAETEHLTIQAMNSVPITPRRDDRGAGGSGNVNASADKKRRNVSNDEGGWSTATSRGSRTPFSVQSDKLKNKPPMMDEPLGSSQMFGNWGRGSNIKTQPQPPLTNTANMYAALENIGTESDKRPAIGLRPNNKDPYSSKGPSLERNYRQPYEDGRGSRSGSQHRSRDSSTASQRNTTPAPVPSAPKAQQPPTGAPPASERVALTPEQLERRLKNILEEYLNDCCTVEECEVDIKSSISPEALPQLVSKGYISVLERSKTARLRTGYLFAQLLKLGTLPLKDYCTGLKGVLEEADELIIDIPRVWDYVAELISPILCESAATLKDLHEPFDLLIMNNHAGKLLVCIFKLIIQEKGPNFLQNCWNISSLTFADYMDESQVASYVKENNFEFLLEPGDSSPVSQSPALGQSQLSHEEMHDKLLAFFKSGTSFDDIINWIAANVGERVKENQFIRTLATACFEDSVVNLKLKTDILQAKYNLLHRFVDNQPAFELQCLYALQALINKLEHPQGLLLAICDKLYEDNLFSHESFVAWEASKDPAEQEGKGVALKQLTSFFTQLKEADEDSSSASEDA